MPVRRPFPLLALCSLTAMALAGCSVEDNPVTTTAGGGTAIEIRSGMNCYSNQCFRYDPSRGTINVSGRRDINPPAGVNLASGSLTPAEFRATFERGMQAKSIGGDEDR